MKNFAIAFATVAGLAFVSATAQAADLVVYDDNLPMMTDTGMVESDWEGAYVGGSLGYYPTFSTATLGGEVGFNFLPAENFLIGMSANGLIYLDGSFDTEFFVRGRAGVVFDNVALYGLASVGIYNVSTALWDVGAGIEVMATDNISFFAEGFLREVVGNIPDTPHIQAGARFHFD